jgi:hypothetical protein
MSYKGGDSKAFSAHTPAVLISVIPACPESFQKDSRRASLAGMTPKTTLQIVDALRFLPQGSLHDLLRTFFCQLQILIFENLLRK